MQSISGRTGQPAAKCADGRPHLVLVAIYNRDVHEEIERCGNSGSLSGRARPADYRRSGRDSRHSLSARSPRCRREQRIMDAAGSVLNQGQEKQRTER